MRHGIPQDGHIICIGHDTFQRLPIVSDVRTKLKEREQRVNMKIKNGANFVLQYLVMQ